MAQPESIKMELNEVYFTSFGASGSEELISLAKMSRDNDCGRNGERLCLMSIYNEFRC